MIIYNTLYKNIFFKLPRDGGINEYKFFLRVYLTLVYVETPGIYFVNCFVIVGGI